MQPCLPTLLKKPCRNAPNSDADNGGAEPNDMGVGIFRSIRRLVRATVVHIEISRSFFYSAGVCYEVPDAMLLVSLPFQWAHSWLLEPKESASSFVASEQPPSAVKVKIP